MSLINLLHTTYISISNSLVFIQQTFGVILKMKYT